LDEFDIHKEPEYHFTPLPMERYCQFYDIEMAHFDSDLPFFLHQAKPGGATLELGCGTGRLTRKLAQSGLQMTGLDISLPMLKRCVCSYTDNINYLCGDIGCFFFQQQFDTIIIPYNTLNLLTRSKINRCLLTCRELLKKRGKLLVQLYVPDGKLIAAEGKRLFQFQIFTQANGTKIIKESIRLYHQKEEWLLLEERYRIRNIRPGRNKNQDYSHLVKFLAFDPENWKKVINKTGFSIQHQYGDYQLNTYIPQQGSCLLLVLTP